MISNTLYSYENCIKNIIQLSYKDEVIIISLNKNIALAIDQCYMLLKNLHLMLEQISEENKVN